MWIVGLCFRFVKTGSPARRAGLLITVYQHSSSKRTCAGGYRHFPPPGHNRDLKLAFSKPNLSLISTWPCGSVVPDCLWATYRFPAVLCSRVSFRLSVRLVVSRVILRGSTSYCFSHCPIRAYKMNVEYIKDYKYKELKQYVLAYLLIAVASVGFYVKDTIGAVGLLSALSSMIAIDTLAGAICALVFILNEFWPDKVKQQIIYKDMPSDTVFTDIASGKIDAAGFDLAKAKEMFAHLSNAPANQQTAEWNDLLRKCKDAERGNVIDAERMQLMTRDICMSTISLLVMTLIAFGVLAVAYMSLVTAIKILYIPLVYLVIMWFVTKKAAKSRANRIVVLVIKNAVQGL